MGINRRRFLSVACGIGGIVVPSTLTGQMKSEPDSVTIVGTATNAHIEFLKEYRGYSLRWTGWKTDQSSDLIYAQWVATPIGWSMRTADRFHPLCHIYATNAGLVAWYCPGYTFNIWEGDLPWPEKILSIRATDEQKLLAQSRMIGQLTKFIDENGIRYAQ